MASEGADGVDAGGSDRRVRIAEAADDAGEDLRKVRRERVAVALREDGKEADALSPHRGLVGGVGGVDAGDERAKGARLEVASNGLELYGGYAIGITVGELVQAREDAVLEVLRRRDGGGERHFCSRADISLRISRLQWWLRRQDLRRHRRRLRRFELGFAFSVEL